MNYSHTGPGFADHGSGVSCASCHTANTEKAVWKRPALQPDCAACHAADFLPGPHVKYESASVFYYKVGELRDCAGACHIYTDSSLTTIKETKNGEHQANRGAW